MKRYKLGIAGMVHDHVWGELNHWRSLGNIEFVAAADINEPLRKKVQDEFGVLRTYATLNEMLDAEKLDVVQAASENSGCAEIVEACASRGIHVVSEKPMAATLDQADRMLRAATNADIKLLINWPIAWGGPIPEWLRLIVAGEIGDLTYVKFRSAHNGPKEIGCSVYFWSWLYDAQKNGAGALMDYCCYAADIFASLLGRPEQVMGMRGTFVKDYPVPDDNAIIVAKYKHAFGVSEASWTQPTGYAGSNPIAYGTKGSLAVSQGNIVLCRPGQEPKTITPPAPEYPYRSGPEYLLYCIENQAPVEGLCSPKVSRDAQEILQAGLRSADSGTTITLPH